MKILMSSLVDLKKSQHNRPHQFAKYLSLNHDVTVISVNDWWKGDQGDLELYSSDFNHIFDNIEYHHLTERKISPFIQEVLFTKKIKELSKRDFDIHLNYNSMILGYRTSKHFKTVLDLADDIPAMIRMTPQIPRPLRPLGGFMGKYYLKKCIKAADFVTLTTEELNRNLKIPKSKFSTIPNGVDIEMFRNIKNAKDELGLEGFIVGYVGVLREWVDLEPVFKALKYLDQNIKLLVVGSEGRFKEKQDLAKKYGIDHRVIFTGMVPYSQVPKYISAMDVGLIPFKEGSVSENALPIKLFEYMACEKPVISTETSVIKSTFGNSVLYASRCKEYKEKIEMLYQNWDIVIELGNNGRKIVQNEYNWKSIVGELEKVLIKEIE